MTQHIEEARKLAKDYAVGWLEEVAVKAFAAALAAAEERGRMEERESSKDGNRSLPFDRDTLGRFVREAWVRWALTQPSPKPSWLVPYDELDELDKEADRQIGEAVARWTLVGDSATITKEPTP